MNLAKVIRRHEQGDCVTMIGQFAGISQTQTGKPFVKWRTDTRLALNLVRTGLVHARLTNRQIGITGEGYNVAEFHYEATDLGRIFSWWLEK
jgi:hypothetical protein